MTLTWQKTKDYLVIGIGSALVLVLVGLFSGQIQIQRDQASIQRDIATLIAESKHDRERDATIDHQIEQLASMDQVLAKMVNDFRIQAAKHGWEEGRP